MINISKPIKYPTYNCYDNNIISPILRYLGREIRPYFLGDFNIKLEKISTSNNYRIATSTRYTDILLKDFCGIVLKHYTKISNGIGIEEIIQKEFEHNNIVGIKADSFDCPWNKKFFHDIHMEHYFTIYGDPKDLNHIFCYDSFFSDKIEITSIDFLKEIYCGIIQFELTEFDYTEALRSINQYLLNSLTYNHVDRYNELMSISSLLEGFDFEREIQIINNDITRSDLVFNISNVLNSRMNYYDSLVFYQKLGIIHINNSIVDDLKELIDYWEIIKVFIIKGLYQKNKARWNDAIEILKKVAFSETALYNKILDNLVQSIDLSVIDF